MAEVSDILDKLGIEYKDLGEKKSWRSTDGSHTIFIRDPCKYAPGAPRARIKRARLGPTDKTWSLMKTQPGGAGGLILARDAKTFLRSST